MKRLKHFFISLSTLSLLSLFPLQPCYSASYSDLSKEKTYLITETELNELENNLETYKAIANDLQKQTNLLKQSLNELEKENKRATIKTSVLVGTVTFTVAIPVGILIGYSICNSLK